QSSKSKVRSRTKRPARMSVVNPKSLPAPVGFNHGVLIEGGKILFLAGQNGANQGSEIVSDDFTAQFEAALENLLAVLKEAGGKPEQLGLMNIYVTSREEYGGARKAIGSVWKKHLGRHYPACAMFEVKGLWDPRAKVELEGIAVL
ncbi:MAG TPA: RidA family protein, partial [Planctomycetota bacterium]|nr:RidA family protein [Planctomycetota bacterium]